MFSIRGRIEAIKFSLKASNDENTTNYLKGMFETLLIFTQTMGWTFFTRYPMTKSFSTTLRGKSFPNSMRMVFSKRFSKQLG